MSLSAFADRIKKELELKKRINEAKKNGRYFITITYLNKDKLEHFWSMNKFPTKLVFPALSTMYNEIDKKEILFKDLLEGNEKWSR